MNKALFALLLGLAALGAAGAAAFVRFGMYDIAATSSHTGIVYSLLETTMRYAVQRRAADLVPPPLDDPQRVAHGAACYRAHCVQCHGGPGVAQDDIGKSLQPLPGPLVDAVRRWQPAEVYWITRHGIKMSGMPAWEVRLSDADLWAVTAFVNRLPALSPADYRDTMAAVAGDTCPSASQACTGDGPCDRPTADLAPVRPRDTDARARLVLAQYACSTCHRVPDVVGPDTDVGPPLDDLARRGTLGNGLPNTRDHLIRWIQDPRRLDPHTAMPDLGVTDAHAGMMADYLLKPR